MRMSLHCYAEKCEYSFPIGPWKMQRNFIRRLVARGPPKEMGMDGGSMVSMDSLDKEKVVISTRRKAVNCGEDGDDMYNLK